MKAILGGGIGGLSAAYYLRNKCAQDIIKLYESSPYLGGWIKSTQLPNGVIFEQGPRTLRPKGEAGFNTLQLIDDLGLSNQISPIRVSHPAARTRMIYAHGKLHTLPATILDVFVPMSPFTKPLIAYVFNDLVTKKQIVENNDESIYSFVERRFGKDLAQYAISPMICGICAGDAKEISVKFLMKSMFEKEQRYGGVIKGMLLNLIKNGVTETQDFETILVDKAKSERWAIYSFDQGMQVLPKTLEEKLRAEKVELLVNKTCNDMQFENGIVKLTINSDTQPFDHVISSLPAQKLASLVEKQHPELADNLKKIPTVDVAVVNLYYQDNQNIKDAFGFLVPPSENLPILGVIFDSCCFPKNSGTCLTVMMGGHWFEKHFGKHPKEDLLLNIAKQQIKNIMNIYDEPQMTKLSILRQCIPQYKIGHFDVVNNIKQYIERNRLPLSICGSSYYGVGVNDVILSAAYLTSSKAFLALLSSSFMVNKSLTRAYFRGSFLTKKTISST